MLQKLHIPVGRKTAFRIFAALYIAAALMLFGSAVQIAYGAELPLANGAHWKTTLFLSAPQDAQARADGR